MNSEVIISCAITGSGDTSKKHPNLPITPKQIAEDSCWQTIDDTQARELAIQLSLAS